jgi:hypothetical protein
VVDAIGAAGSRAIAASAELLDRAGLLSESTRFQRYGIGSPMLNDCCQATRPPAGRASSHSAAAHRPRIKHGWSVYGAKRSQPVATGGKWTGCENGPNRRKARQDEVKTRKLYQADFTDEEFVDLTLELTTPLYETFNFFEFPRSAAEQELENPRRGV